MKGFNPRFLKMRGKVQDIVVSQDAGMPIVRGRNFTNESNSPLQREARSQLGSLGSTFKHETSATQKNQWLLLSHQVHDPGRKRPLSAQNCFVMVNSARLATNKPLLLDAPTAPDFAPSLQDIWLTAAHVSGHPGGLLLQLNAKANWNYPIQVYGQKPVLAAYNVYLKSGWAVLGTLPSLPSGATDVSSLYTSKYGLLEPGMKAAFLINAVSPLGFKSNSLFTEAIFFAVSAENAGGDNDGALELA